MSAVSLSSSTTQTVPRIRTWLRNLARNYVVRRLAVALLKIYIVVTLTFFIIRLMPSNPIDAYIAELMDLYGYSYEDARDEAAALFGIDLEAPVWKQYIDYLIDLLHGDLGTSYRSKGTPVKALIAKYLPWTLFSVGTALLISFTLGMLLGMAMAYWRGSWFDHLLTTLASIISAIPNYLIAMMLLVFLGVQWKILPIAKMRGAYSPGMKPSLSWAFIKDVFYHAALPITTYILTTVGGWMLAMKSSTLSTLGEDYVTVAKARGLPERRIVTAYVGRNASLPLVTQLAISIGFVVGGSTLIEFIFVYQGIGQLLLSSINTRDYPVMQGVFLVITIAVILANFLAEFVYGWLDPRVRVR
ncbi:MAG: ABC transporter permease [Chloroflexi bacterium]|nr:ABC transporter permease [Chloroflexota bacterium]